MGGRHHRAKSCTSATLRGRFSRTPRCDDSPALVSMERPAPFRICVDHPPEADGANIRKEPATPSVSRRAVIHLGLDVHKDSISVAVLEPGRETPEVDKIFNDEYSVRHLIGRFSEPRSLRACYEAGPTGYDLHRLLTSLGVPCEV